MDEVIKMQNNITGGVAYASENSGDFNVWEHVGSSAWLYLLITNPNVFFLDLSNSNNLPKFRVTFDLNGASGTAPHIQMVPANGYAAAPANPAHHLGAVFSGWFTNSAGTGSPFNFSTAQVTSNLTLYAKWTHRLAVIKNPNSSVHTVPPFRLKVQYLFINLNTIVSDLPYYNNSLADSDFSGSAVTLEDFPWPISISVNGEAKTFTGSAQWIAKFVPILIEIL